MIVVKHGFGAPQSYLDVIDRCMCNLNVQICDQKIKDTDTKKKEPPPLPGPFAMPKKPQINVQVCKFNKGASGISRDDWTDMKQCCYDAEKARDMAALQADLLKEVKGKAAAGADAMANPLATGNESVVSTSAETCKHGFCKPKMDLGGDQLDGESKEEYDARIGIPKLGESECKKIKDKADWIPAEKCDDGTPCPKCGEGKKVCPCPIDPELAKLEPTSGIDTRQKEKLSWTTANNYYQKWLRVVQH